MNWCVVHQLKRWRTNLQLSISSIDPSAFRLVSFVIFAPSEATQSTKVTWTSFIVSSSLFFSVVVVSSFDDDARRTLFVDKVFFRWWCCVCTKRRDRWWWWCFEDWTMMFRWCSRRRRECCWRRKTLFWCFWWVVEKEDDFEDIIVVVLTKVGEVFGRRRVIYIERESVKASRFLKSGIFCAFFYIQKKQLLSLGFVTEKNPKLYKP